MVSVETGKTISKSWKTTIRNGSCQWTETLSESIWISWEDASKQLEQRLLKLVVSMGSSRSGFLGEDIINLVDYMSLKVSALISLPLKRCNHGTIIQIEILCITPRTELRDENWQDTNSYKEDSNSQYDYIDNKSDVSGCTFSRSVGSPSSNHLESTSHPGELANRETSSSISGSRNSFDSMEGSLGRESFSSRSSLGVVNNAIGRQESISSLNSAPQSPYLLYDSPRSFFSPYSSAIPGSGRNLHNQREDSGRISRAIATSPLRYAV